MLTEMSSHGFRSWCENPDSFRSNRHQDILASISEQGFTYVAGYYQNVETEYELRLVPQDLNRNKSNRPTPEAQEMCQRLLGRSWK